jgi:hypothetical protein
VKRRKGAFHYIEIVVLMLVAYPACVFAGVFSIGINTPTPGIYAASLLPAPTEPFDLFLTRLTVAGFANVVCCYGVIRGLVAVISPFRRQKDDPATPNTLSGRGEQF